MTTNGAAQALAPTALDVRDAPADPATPATPLEAPRPFPGAVEVPHRTTSRRYATELRAILARWMPMLESEFGAQDLLAALRALAERMEGRR